jgi:hypothetical protein
MIQRKDSSAGRRRVWRVTKDAPLGEYVDPDEVRREPQHQLPPNDPFEQPEPGWLMSSFELAHGLEVHEHADTVPGELLDEFLRRRQRLP